jgi:hypothetical protein
VTSPENPLFARVMVNRIWQYHFGVGLVATPDNFGRSGAQPSHPELLDFLTTEFRRAGWSVKALHRLILTSAAYRQSSVFRESGFESDPDNRLLWRFPLRRLDAEAIRDAMLNIAGELDTTEGAPFVPTNRTDDGSVVVEEKSNGARKRSVYLQQRRTQVPTLLEVFDTPSVVTNCAFRNTSTVPLQALALLNSDFARRRAQTFARRLEKEVGADRHKRIDLAFRLAYGRKPGEKEIDAAERFLNAQEQVYSPEKNADAGRAGVGRPTRVSDRRVWEDFCQMILSSNGFLYVE